MDHEEMEKVLSKMEFGVWPRGCGQGRGWEDATTKELRKLTEEVAMLRRSGNPLEEMSDEEEKYVE